MIRIAISIEGQTENEFVKKVLAPYLVNYNIFITPIIITTSKDRCGRKHKGGCVNIDRVKNEIKKLLPNYDYVTTFYNFYGFVDRPTDDVDELERIIFELFNDNKFIPYIQQYEFETLLFSKPEYYEEYFGDSHVTERMKQVIKEFNGDIEMINDSPQTAPSKRIEQLFDEISKSYDKVFHGEGIVGDIGIEHIINRANRFKKWIEKIKSLGAIND